MRIIIAGAGEVGTHLAKLLVHENVETTLIDENQERLATLSDKYDLMLHQGSPTSVKDLKEVQADKADLFIAVTPYESVNMTSCMLANSLGAKSTLARIDNYELLLLLYGLQFVCVYAVRATITGNATALIHRGKWQFNTFIIGCGSKAVKQMRELEEPRHSLGYRIVGFIRVNDETADPEIADRTYPMEELPRLCQEMKIQELIVAPEEDNLVELHRLINTLYPLNLPIKLGTDEFNIISSRVRLTNIYGAPLIDMSNCAISEGGKNMKRMFDILVSAVALVLLSPLFVVLAILIKRDSSGPVFYQQERIGYRHRPFKIYKFRTMKSDAESGTPLLSEENDRRITRIGRVLRKYRLDELPQFWNVLKGDMSLVGPRPEREYFIRQIVERVPYYVLLHQIRPGITSWGMVKYGYARNIDEMIARLKYDILYLENMSLLVDLKIIIYTIRTVVTGKGM